MKRVRYLITTRGIKKKRSKGERIGKKGDPRRETMMRGSTPEGGLVGGYSLEFRGLDEGERESHADGKNR